MQVLQINNSQNFKGLWGKNKELMSGDGDVWFIEKTESYHPFKDETINEINKAKKQHSYNSCNSWAEYGYNFVYDIKKVQEEKRLPFTQQEFNSYKATKKGAKVPEELSNPIEKELVRLELYKYLNNAKEYINGLAIRNTLSYKMKQLFSKIKAIFK